MSSEAHSYTVAWICALPIEYAIACALLETRYSEHESPVISNYDSNVYTFGRISGHNVVVASFLFGHYGVSNSVLLVDSIINSFPEVRFCLLVGIGGGVSSENHDIRLGDVVVGSPTPRHGGVIEYDFGKSIQDLKLETIGYLATPPGFLLNAMSVLNSRHRRRGNQIKQTITSLFNRHNHLQETYCRPDTVQDILYKASSEGHKHSVIIRRPRTENEDDPEVHYGLIASGYQLIKDGMIRDVLAAQDDVLCFEMEAVGLMNELPCLVIRGICDYSDNHKNKIWQGYAAATSAAYAIEILSIIPATKFTPRQTIQAKNEEDPFQVAAGNILESVAQLKSMILSTHIASTAVLQLEGCLFILRRVIGALLTAGLHGRHAQAAVLRPLLSRIAASMESMEKILRTYMPASGRRRNLKSRVPWAVGDEDEMDDLIRGLSSKIDKFVAFIKSHNLANLPDVKSASAPADDLIIVMGQTGVGKSRLIQKITGSWDIAIGHTLESETMTIAPYSVILDGRTVTLIDTPGFDDTELTDAEVLAELASWMALTYSKGYRLSGLLYLSPITAPRMTGTSRLGLEVFEHLVGEDSYSKIILVTTMWDLVQSRSRGEAREEQLKNSFWRNMLAVGSRTMRSFGNEETAIAIIRTLISGLKQSGTSAPLAIQREMVEEEKPLASTAAGEIFAAKLAEMALNYDDQFRKIQAELNILGQRNAERMEQVNSLQAQVNSLREERDILLTTRSLESHIGYNDPPPYTTLESRPADLENP